MKLINNIFLLVVFGLILFFSCEVFVNTKIPPITVCVSQWTDELPRARDNNHSNNTINFGIVQYKNVHGITSTD